MAFTLCEEHAKAGSSLAIMWCPKCVSATQSAASHEPPTLYPDPHDFYRPAELTHPVDANGSPVVEAGSYVGPCPGTWGLGPCTETLGAGDVINGKTVCWRCGWRSA